MGEAMQSSLLSLVEASSLENLVQLDELFCRDTEPFSELFEVDDQINRPASCPPLVDQYCAVLYDSADCSGGWQLNVTVGEQRSFSYFSSDWSYRNDADVVGDSFSLSAGDTDRWAVFERNRQLVHFHEELL